MADKGEDEFAIYKDSEIIGKVEIWNLFIKIISILKF